MKEADLGQQLTSLGYSEETLSKVSDIVEDLYEFVRCQRPSGKIYGTRLRCKPPSVEIGAKGKVSSGSSPSRSEPKAKRIRIGKNVRDMSVEDLETLLRDPRVKPHQAKKIQSLIDEKKKPSVGPEGRKTGRTKEQKEERKKLRKEVEIDRELLQGDIDIKKSRGLDARESLRTRYETMKAVYKDPAFRTPANRSRMISMRLALWEMEKASRERNNRPVSTDLKKLAESSPKYQRTPGSSKPIPSPKKTDTSSMERELEAAKKKFTKLYGKASPTEEERAETVKLSQRMLRLGSEISAIQDGRPPSLPSLKEIYEIQGFNAKPELVPSVRDLRSRKDVLMGSDGSPVILYRGVSEVRFADQFKGLGPDGGTHFPGRGLFGNGSYAAAASDSSPATTQNAALRTAKGYSGDQENLDRKVTAFALREDSRVQTFRNSDYSEREKAYDRWFDTTIEEARQKTGYAVSDIGEAAAALGYHGYQVPQRGEDYYVILNRGAIIAAMDPGELD